MIINVANLASLFKAYNAKFQDAFKRAEATWSTVATEVPSSGESNFYPFLGQFPRLREWIGDRVIKDLTVHDYTLVNKSFESTVSVPAPKIEDDTYGVFSPMMSEMGYAAKTHPGELVYGALALGASELCYDGQYFFDTDHPVVVSGAETVAANYDATGGGSLWALMDTRRPLKPLIYQNRKPYNFQSFNRPNDEYVFNTNKYKFGVDARAVAGFGLWQLAYGSLNDIDDTNFDTYNTAMTSLKSDEGRPLGIRPNLLVCGPSRESEARNLIEVERLANGASNPYYKRVEILVTPWLT